MMRMKSGCSGDAPPAALLVDLESDRAVLSDALARAGYRVSRCATALEAIHQVEQGQTAVLISALYLAHLTGTELAGVARRLNPSMIIVLVAGDHDRIPKEAALRAGANTLLTRPLRVEAVLQSLTPVPRS